MTRNYKRFNVRSIFRSTRDSAIDLERHMPTALPKLITNRQRYLFDRPYQLASLTPSTAGRSLAKTQKISYAEFDGEVSRYRIISPIDNSKLYTRADLWINPQDSRGNEIVLSGIPLANDDEDEIRSLLASEYLRRKLWLKQARRILLEKHTSTSQSLPFVTVICATNRPDFLSHLRKQFEQQSYPNRELIVLTHGFQSDGCIQAPSSQSLGSCLNQLLAEAKGEIIAKFDDDDFYLPEYISDQVLWLLEKDADLVGKSANYIYFSEDRSIGIRRKHEANKFTNFVTGATLLGRREVFQELGFSDLPRGEDSDFLKRAGSSSKKIYSTDSLNFMINRHGSHTWNTTDSVLRRSTQIETFGLNLDHVSG